MEESSASNSSGKQVIAWQASEYVAHEKSAGWHFALLGGSLVIISIVYLVTRDVFACGAIFIAAALVSIFAVRQPSTRSYEITEDGVTVGSKHYAFSRFKSFAVMEDGMMISVWLRPLKNLSPPIVMYVVPEQENEIIDILQHYLPVEERKPDGFDRFSKYIRF